MFILYNERDSSVGINWGVFIKAEHYSSLRLYRHDLQVVSVNVIASSRSICIESTDAHGGNMKIRFCVALVLLASLMMVLNGGAAAQAPSPYRLPQQAAPGASTVGAPAANLPTVSLGQPGTSFRYVQTFGITNQAYPADVQHINQPVAVFVDSSDNVFVVEEKGSRVLKYRGSDLANLLSLGTAGKDNRASDSFALPQDAVVGPDGNIWVADSNRIAKYDASGNFLLEFPPADPWASGSDNSHFNNPRALVFDSAGRLYVSDYNNHRIQVFDIIDGAPVYNATIGHSGVSGSADGYFNLPGHLAFDSSNRLYVADSNNNRVQRCTFASSTWTCTTYFGTSGVSGTDLTHLSGWFFGLMIRNDTLYIADFLNQRVLKCATPATCTVFAGVTGAAGSDNSHFYYPSGVAVDSAGNVYVSDTANHRVQKFNSSGVWTGRIGVTQVPYVTDSVRINTPGGMTIDADGSLYFIERRGARLVKLNAAGVQQWTAGTAGVWGNDNAHFGGFWDDLMSFPAVDNAGKVYVPDPGNNRIQIFDASTGGFLTTWITSGPTQFNCPQAVAISPVNGDFYVADRCNDRILVFNSSQVYKMQLGSGVYGSSDTQFAAPTNVAVDSLGAVYVTDQDNVRVQKCTISLATYVCSAFDGAAGVRDSRYDHLAWPHQVAVDRTGKVYVTDSSNSRVKVFDPSGALLTIIGGDWNWGSGPGELMEPVGLAIDLVGNLFVGDTHNSRIQKFSPGVFGWRQANINGFGIDHANVLALEEFNGQLYAGTANWETGLAQVWRSPDGRTWSAASQPGFGDANPAVITMKSFAGKLYAGTGWGSSAGQLWRYDGTSWEKVADNGFGSGLSMDTMTVFKSMLYVCAGSGVAGFQVWRSSSGDANSWTSVATGGFDDATNTEITGWATFNGDLYAAVSNPSLNGRILRTSNGLDWNWASPAGFGESGNIETGGFAILNGYLYIGTKNNNTGGQIWRSGDGTTWTKVMGNGFGDANNGKVDSLYSFGGSLYAGTSNFPTGVEIWNSSNGTNWQQANPDGFGLSTNWGVLWANSVTTFNNKLFYGTWSNAGGQVWQLLSNLYLPNVMK
jgi:DNA-binding beta-propeller fold protein YncE